MSFLAPLFLLGGLALIGPVVFHLIRRTTRERTAFSSLMFLQPSPPRLSRRSRLEHWLLLVLRCLALALLALGFARPFVRQAPLLDPTTAQPRRVAVLVDVSASMRRADLWAGARERVAAAVRGAAAADQVAVFTFERKATPLVSFAEWNRAAAGDRAGLVQSRLDTVKPGWGGTQLGNALITAAEALAETDGKAAPTGPREIILISDLQAGSRLDTLQAYEWPKGVALVVEPLKARHATNAGIQLVADSAESAAAVGAAVRVRVVNAPESQREQFQVGWRGAAGSAFAGPPVEVYVPPGQSRVAVIPVPKGVTGLTQIALRGDDEEFDNTVFALPPTQQKLSVLWLGSDAPDDTRQPLFFLRRALSDSPRLAVRVIARAPNAPLLPAEVADATVIVVTEALAGPAAEALRAQALAGKTILFAPKSAAAAPTLAALLDHAGLTLEEVKPANYAMFAEIDFRHPLFAPFADPRFSDFTKIHIWKYRKLVAAGLPGAHVVVQFDNGDPALLDVPAGRGRIVILTAGWQPDDSQLAVSSKFVPLIYSLLELAGGSAEGPAHYVVGDAVPLPATGGPFAVQGPAGNPEPIPAGATTFDRTSEPGLYALTVGGRVQRFAVNLEASESRTAPLSADELEHLGVPVAAANPAAAPSPEAARLLAGPEAENRQKLWRWFVVATLCALLLETALAGRAARQLNPKIQEAPS
jgi:hypothetical protein